MSNTKRKKKILVLGGGLSGLAAAHELTNYPGWNDHYDVSLYQMGWRLGGKCATGRGGKNDRIEEHGIHVFLGFYNNAIRMVREAFDEWKATDPEAAQYFKDEDWQTLFSRQDSILLPEYSVSENRWLNWPLIFPTNELLPGYRGSTEQTSQSKENVVAGCRNDAGVALSGEKPGLPGVLHPRHLAQSLARYDASESQQDNPLPPPLTQNTMKARSP
jgi:uncharacterized protein with NAD-binding domain and iron-sulfur cluster